MAARQRFRVLIMVCSAAVLPACGTFYANPGSNEAAAVFIEVSERSGLSATRSIMLAHVDGKPVSHMGAGGDGWEIRVAPGQRQMLFKVSYKKDEPRSIFSMESPWHQAYFPIQLSPVAGKRYRLGNTVGEGERVTFTITDLSRPGAPWVSCTAIARRVIPGMTVAIPGSTFVTIPGKTPPAEFEGCIVAEAAPTT